MVGKMIKNGLCEFVCSGNNNGIWNDVVSGLISYRNVWYNC